MATTAKAVLRNYRQSPRKVRLVADFIRGKDVDKALTSLRFLNKKATDPISDLVKSAQANAKNLNMNPDALVIKEIAVNEGTILYRRKARARGRAVAIRKRTSHVTLVLSEKEGVSEKVSPETEVNEPYSGSKDEKTKKEEKAKV